MGNTAKSWREEGACRRETWRWGGHLRPCRWLQPGLWKAGVPLAQVPNSVLGHSAAGGALPETVLGFSCFRCSQTPE